MLALSCFSRFSPIYREILRVFNAALAELPIFPNSGEKRLYFQNCSQFTKDFGKLGFMKSPWFQVYQIVRIAFEARYTCRRERGSNLILYHEFSRKINVHFYIAILCQSAWNTLSKLR